jgi:hypothetical protein
MVITHNLEVTANTNEVQTPLLLLYLEEYRGKGESS